MELQRSLYLYYAKEWVQSACQHGILPVPVPAVTHIVQQCDLDLRITPVQGELVTPTGAAIVAAVRTSCKLPETFAIEKTGIGAGKRTYECPESCVQC